MGRRASRGALEPEDDPSWATGYTPFFMVYVSEAILPTDLDYGAPRVRAYNEQGAKASLEDAMDKLDAARDVALLRSAKYQQALRWYHSRRVWGRAFNVGDLVLYLVQSNKNRHKLRTINGEVFVNAWNIEQLCRFYP